jgi:RNA polymerase sigma-70 factor, ECF subfamily
MLRQGFVLQDVSPHDVTKTGLSTEFMARLRAFVRRRVRADSDVDDLVQDVLYKLIQQGEGAIKGSVHAWLFTVARRAIIDRYRGRKAAGQLDATREPASVEETESAVSELARCLQPMLGSLAREDRSLLVRVDKNGETQADLARELGLSPSTVKSKVQRARVRLRRTLEDCCSLELDARGEPMDYKRRPGRSCPCQGDCK